MVLTALDAKPGHNFLLVVFPATTAGFTYKKQDFSLLLQGTTTGQQPDLFTTGFGVNPIDYSFCTSEDAFYPGYNIPIVRPPGRSQRLAVAFEIPQGSNKGVLTIQGVANTILW